jgi:hypothetical protein
MNTPVLFSEIELSRITVPPDRLRALQPDKVDELAKSIGRAGLQHPIRVRVKNGGGYELIAGRHRLEAARKLDHKTILAGVVEDIDADQARLDEIDENLIRAELSPAERARHLAERKRIYEKLHPETKSTSKGGPGRAKQTRRQNGDESVDRFTKDTAKKTGKSERTIQREVERGEKVGGVVLADIAGTSLDKGDEIDALAKLSEDEQIALAERAKAGEKVTARKITPVVPAPSFRTWMKLFQTLCNTLPKPNPNWTPKENDEARALFNELADKYVAEIGPSMIDGGDAGSGPAPDLRTVAGVRAAKRARAVRAAARKVRRAR